MVTISIDDNIVDGHLMKSVKWDINPRKEKEMVLAIFNYDDTKTKKLKGFISLNESEAKWLIATLREF